MKNVSTPRGAPAAEDYRIYFEIGPSASLVLDSSFGVLAVSDRFLDLMGTQRETMIGRPIFELFPKNPEDPRGRGQRALRASLERVLRDGKPDAMSPLRYDIPRSPERGGGFEERWWAPLNTPAFGPDGSICAIVLSVEDVTARKRLEQEKADQELEHAREVQRFRALVRATHDAIWDYDLREDRITWNENLALAFGHEPASMSTLEAWLGSIRAEDRDRVERSIREALEDPADLKPWGEEYGFTRGDGSPAWVYDRGLILKNEQGEPVRMIGSMQDITDRVETVRELERVRNEMEAALKENRRILEHSRDIFTVVDEGGRFTRVSEAARRVLGYDPADLEGRHFTDFIHPDDRSASVEARARVKEGQPVSTFRNRFLSKDGTAVPLMWSSVWVPEDRVSYAVGRDVTELEEAEREIQKLGDHLATTLESISQACFTVDREWRFIYMNRQFEEFVGRPREELIGKVLWDEFPQGLDSAYLPNYRRAMDERVTVNFEAEVPTRGGWFDVTAHPTPDGIAILFRDITARKLSARRLEEQAAAIDQAQDAIIIRDLDHRIRGWNASAERLYGYKAEDVMGRRIDSFLHSDPESLAHAIEVFFEKGQWSGELELNHADGGTRIVDARWSLLRREDETPYAILAIHSDLTERKQIEAQFLRAQRMESLGRLAGGIAHDLNNVLSPVLMATSLLREVAGGDDLVRETLDAMESSANRGAEMVKQVLLFARGVEGKHVQVSLVAVIDEVRRMLEETFPKGVLVKVEHGPDIWPVMGDATQLHQVLLNLCVNARDSFPDGRGSISITTSNAEVDEQYATMNPQAVPGSFVRIEVSDSGPGIAPDIIEHVFEPFFTTKDVGSGTGLGLATVQGIVKSHGGWVNVYSEQGNGTVFSVYLPADLGAAEASPSADSASAPRGRGELILVVDDEASILTITRHTLESFGYRVMTAGDGAEAIALYSRHQSEIALVLTDMMMPVMDGVALIHAIRRLSTGARIIAASGLGANGSVAKAAHEGVRSFLPKPYTADKMLKLVREVLDAPAPSQEGERPS